MDTRNPGKRADPSSCALRRCRLAGAVLVVVDMPETNTLTIGMMATLAQYESELISEHAPNLVRDPNTDTRAARAEHVRQAVARNDELRGVIGELC